MSKATFQSSKWLGIFIAIAFGCFAFFVIVGPKALNPVNLDWIYGIDPTQHYLGWTFFRYGPWTFPLGLNPHFGLEISSSIVFSDSIPLLAILFKPFSVWLPDPFQYLGIWMLICLVLQAYFAYLLMGLMTGRLALRVLGMGLLVFAPPMLWRIGLHAALVSHFLILAAFYLVFSGRNTKTYGWWILLLVVTSLVHVYLLLMVLCIWFGNVLDELCIRRSVSLRQAFSQILMTLVILGICLWQIGYFAVGLGSAATLDLYGGWGLNIASFFDPQGWSYIKRIWPTVTGNAESFFYFGLGIILLAFIALYVLAVKPPLLLKHLAHHLFLVASLLLLLLFAITNHVTIGTLHFSYPLPLNWIEHYASIFRLSARLAWPIWYALVLTILFLIIRYFSFANACFILGLAFILQVIDTSSGYLPMRARHQAVQDLRFGQPTVSDFWRQAAMRYNNVRFFPLRANPLPQPNWYTLATYAARYHLATNAVYLSRLDQAKVSAANQQFREQLRRQALDSDTLYIFEDANIANVRPFVNRSTDYLAKFDGNLSVLAPHWKTCGDCPMDAYERAVDALLVEPALGQRIGFSDSMLGGKIVGWGWAAPESWGVWAKDPFALLTFILPKHARSVTFEFTALVSKTHPQQRIKIRLNDGPAVLYTLTQSQNNRIHIEIPPQVQGPYIQFELEFLDAVRPKDLGMGEDIRKLSVGLLAVTFQK